jgi:Family of unknown function (DUF6174)
MLILSWFACAVFQNGNQQDLDAAQDRWDANAPTHYRYVEDEPSMANVDGPVAIEVDGGEVVSATIVATGLDAPDDRWLTAEDLFGRVQDEIDSDPFELTVTYDGMYGFVADMAVDPIENAIDDEHELLASDFEVIQ